MNKIIKKIISFIFSKNIFLIIKQIIENNSYIKIKVNSKIINFFCPNELTKWRVKTLYKKEPETLEWIDNFEQNKQIIFWDIGANIGLYSIYAAVKFKNISVISFEPSSSNLRILSRNISINELENKINICQFPLSELSNHFSMMKETFFIEGGAMNMFGDNKDFEGKDFVSKMNYSIFGTSIKALLDQKILELPNYIKIDVDGIEHLILKGADNYLINPNIKEILIEINENFSEQKKYVFEIMKKNNFNFIWKRNNVDFIENKSLSNTFNFLFSKNSVDKY
jgi:FkbM family methyltransferase